MPLPDSQEAPIHRPPPPRSKSLLRGVMFVLFLIVAIPVGYIALSKEVANWYTAAAEESMLEGDSAAAIGYAGKAIGWDSKNWTRYTYRSQLYLLAEQFEESLADLDRASELSGDLGTNLLRSSVLAEMGRFDEAAQLCKQRVQQIVKDGDTVSSSLLNQWAYMRALADTELEQARSDIDTAIEEEHNETLMLTPEGYLYLAAGTQYFTDGRPARALSLMNRAVKQIHQQYVRTEQRRQALGRDDEQYNERLEILRQLLAKSLYQRWRTNQKLKRSEAAEKDAELLAKLGFEPTNALKPQLSLAGVLQQILTTAAFYDTRGYVAWRQGDASRATADLKTAVKFAQLGSLALDWFLDMRQHLTPDTRQIEQQVDESKETMAVLLYHRSLAHELAGREELAEADRQQVREMGFEPDDSLF